MPPTAGTSFEKISDDPLRYIQVQTDVKLANLGWQDFIHVFSFKYFMLTKAAFI